MGVKFQHDGLALSVWLGYYQWFQRSFVTSVVMTVCVSAYKISRSLRPSGGARKTREAGFLVVFHFLAGLYQQINP